MRPQRRTSRRRRLRTDDRTERRPDRWEVIGAVICLVGVAVIMYAPRAAPA
ncbi:hypothetical protein [Nocardia gamkensis]|uniref:hypothetical protein n=1 Tax=Nocardia gamkensis TaxID=352869 RepID=UPI0035A0EA4F